MGHFQPLVIYRDENIDRKDSIIRYIGNRVNRYNKNFLCAVVGQTGSGKSWSCLSIAEKYAEMFGIEFNPKYHVVDSLKELLLLITAPEKDRKIKFGSIIVFDEPQAEANSRNWQSEMNKALSQLISTFRNQRLVVLFATPYLEMIDKQSRILFHGEFKVEGYDKNTGFTTIKPRFLEYNKHKGDFYRKRLIIHYKEKGKSKMSSTKLHLWKINKPSKNVVDIYEAKKKKFTDNLNKKLLNNIELNEKQSEGKNKGNEYFIVKDLYEKNGEDYELMLRTLPHLSPFTIEKYIMFVKKSKKFKKSKEKD